MPECHQPIPNCSVHPHRQQSYRKILHFLRLQSADSIPHVETSLFAHLTSTHRILCEWGRKPDLCLAGLCHAVYGTDGFNPSLLQLDKRHELKALIGDHAEAIVYLYASCDRGFLYPQIRQQSNKSWQYWLKNKLRMLKHKGWRKGWDVPQFRDRFSGEIRKLPIQVWADFLELTFANELEILQRRSSLSAQEKKHWKTLMLPCRPWVSREAFTLARSVLN